MNDLHGLLFLMLFGLPVIASMNFECRTHFICINATNFHICGDFGDGKLRAIDSVVFSCPPRLVCDETSINECHYPVITTTTQVTTVVVNEKTTITDVPITIKKSIKNSEYINNSAKEDVVSDNNSTIAYPMSTTDANNFYNHVVKTTDASIINERLHTLDNIKDISKPVREVNNSETVEQAPKNRTNKTNLQIVTIEISTETTDFDNNAKTQKNIDSSRLETSKTTGSTMKNLVNIANSSTKKESTYAYNITIMPFPEFMMVKSTRTDKVTPLLEVTTNESTREENISTTPLPRMTPDENKRADKVSIMPLPKETSEESTQVDDVTITPLPGMMTERISRADDVSITPLLGVTTERSKQADNASIIHLPEVTTERSIRVDNVIITPLPKVEEAEGISGADIFNITPLQEVMTIWTTRQDHASVTPLPKLTEEGITQADNVRITPLPEVTTEGRIRPENVTIALLPEVMTDGSSQAKNVSKTSLPEVTTKNNAQADNISKMPLQEEAMKNNARADNVSKTPLLQVTTEESARAHNASKTSPPEVMTEESARAYNVIVTPLPEVTIEEAKRAHSVSTTTLPEGMAGGKRNTSVSITLLPQASTEGSIREGISTSYLPHVITEGSLHTDIIPISTTTVPNVTGEGNTGVDSISSALVPDVTTEGSKSTDNINTTAVPNVKTESTTRMDYISITSLPYVKAEGSRHVDISSTTILPVVRDDETKYNINYINIKTLANLTAEASALEDNISSTYLPSATTEGNIQPDNIIATPLPDVTNTRRQESNTTALPTEETVSKTIDSINIWSFNTTEASLQQDKISSTPPAVATVSSKFDSIKVTTFSTTNTSIQEDNTRSTALPTGATFSTEESIPENNTSTSVLQSMATISSTFDSVHTRYVNKNEESGLADSRSTITSRKLTTDALTDEISNTIHHNLTFANKRSTELASRDIVDDSLEINIMNRNNSNNVTRMNVIKHNSTNDVLVATGGLELSQFNASDKSTIGNVTKFISSPSPLLDFNKPTTEVMPSKSDLIANVTEIFEPLMTDTFTVSVNVSPDNNILLINTSKDVHFISDGIHEVGKTLKVLNSTELHNNKPKTSVRDSTSTTKTELGLRQYRTSGNVIFANASKVEHITSKTVKTNNIIAFSNKNSNNTNNTVTKYIDLGANNKKVLHPAYFTEIQQTTLLPNTIETSTLKDMLKINTADKSVALMNSTEILSSQKLKSFKPYITSSLLKPTDETINAGTTSKNHVMTEVQGPNTQDQNIKSDTENPQLKNTINNTKIDTKTKNITNINSLITLLEKNTTETKKLINIPKVKSANTSIGFNTTTILTAYNFKSVSFTTTNISEVTTKEQNQIIQEYMKIKKESPQIHTAITKTTIDTNNNTDSEIGNASNFFKSTIKQNIEFECLMEGRFSDDFTDKFYYICVKNKENFVRFKLGCQSGYRVNKSTVKCESKNENKKRANIYFFSTSISTESAAILLNRQSSVSEVTTTTEIAAATTTEIAGTIQKPKIIVKSKSTVENFDDQKYSTRPETTSELSSEDDTESEELETNTKVPIIMKRYTEPVTVENVLKTQEIGNFEIFKNDLDKEVKHDMPITADIETIQSTTASTKSRLLLDKAVEVLDKENMMTTKSVYIDTVKSGPNFCGESSLTKPLVDTTETNKPVDKATSVIETTTPKKEIEVLFTCPNKKSGKYAELKDCRTFYICTGTENPVVKVCPVGTVFSDFIKQCTKHLEQCIRNNEFECSAEGRYRDVFTNTYYYICVKNKSHFIRFKLGCLNGYHVNESTLKCERNQPSLAQSSVSQENSAGSSEQSAVDKGKLETATEKHRTKRRDTGFKCVEEGRFPDPDNCRKYYVCSKRKDQLRKKKKRCKRHEVFYKDKRHCASAESYECEY